MSIATEWRDLVRVWRGLYLSRGGIPGTRHHSTPEARASAGICAKLADASEKLATLADRLLNAQGKPIWDLATQLRRLATELLRTNGPWLEADSISLTIHRDCDQLVQRVEAAEQADLAAQLNKEPPGAESRRGSVLERAQRVLLKWKKEGRQTTTPEEVAEEAGCSARQLYRLPDFMKALDVFNGREVRSNEQMPSGRRKSDEIAKERMRESSDDN